MRAEEIAKVLPYIRDILDFPSEGILFKDITPVLRNAEIFELVVNALSRVSDTYDLVAGVEARGFIFGAAVAKHSGKGFVPIRKSGKLPYDSHAEAYNLEYGNNVLEIHTDAIFADERILLIDDVLATGGTLGAAIRLVERCGGIVDSVAVLLEIDGLMGRKAFTANFPHIPCHTLLK